MGGGDARTMNNSTDNFANAIVGDNATGMSIRLVRPAVGGETDGQVLLNNYTGNNGKQYNAVVIGTQVWIQEDLQETLYNDSSPIVNETVDGTWAGLTTGAYCTYDNLVSVKTKDGLYFPIVITTDETVLEDKFTPETILGLKFRMANRRKGLK